MEQGARGGAGSRSESKREIHLLVNTIVMVNAKKSGYSDNELT